MSLFAVLLAVLLAGCSGRPSALHPPKLDPRVAADRAMILYDNDGDRKLSAVELEACPGMAANLRIYDQDGDGMISDDEIAQRLQKFVERGVALARLSASVTLDKKPLGGATVRFVPETYLGDEIKVATGTTRPGGAASVAVAEEDLPENQRGIRGIHAGTYRVEITHPEIEIPSKYNSETTLGYETTPGNPYASFILKSQ